MRGTVHDITERRNVDEKLRESEEKYRLTVENIPAAVVVIESDGTVSLTNSEARRLAGPALDLVIGKYSADWASPAIHEDGSTLRQQICR